MNTAHIRRLAGLLFALTLAILATAQAQAAPASATPAAITRPAQNQCVPHKQIETWNSQRAIEARGFNFDLVGTQASAQFQHDLSLNLAANPNNQAYTASRMTEIDSHLPISDRVKCWQATPDKNVVVEFRVRFAESDTPADKTENLELWNAPFPAFDSPNPSSESPLPLTSIGVARTSALGQPLYMASVVQDLNVSTFDGLFAFNTMPTWLNPSDWHRVRLTLSQRSARIEVAQNQHPFETVLVQDLLHPAEPLGFEFSVDNEALPGQFAAVAEPDGMQVDYLSIDMVRAR